MSAVARRYALAAIEAAKSLKELEDLRVRYLGKKSDLNAVMRGISYEPALGPVDWDAISLQALSIPQPHRDPTIDEPALPAVVGHMYLVRTVDDDTDLVALFRVTALMPEDRVAFEWCVIEET